MLNLRYLAARHHFKVGLVTFSRSLCFFPHSYISTGVYVSVRERWSERKCSPLCFLIQGSSLQVQPSPQTVAAARVCVRMGGRLRVKWHPSLAEPHLTTQQLSQGISIRPATLREPRSQRPPLFCCPPRLFLRMKGQPHHMTNKLLLIRVCHFASCSGLQVVPQSRLFKVSFSVKLGVILLQAP